MKTLTKLLITGVVTAGAGYIAGILLAPEKGARTRKKFSRIARNLYYDVDEIEHKIKDSIMDASDSLKDKSYVSGRRFYKMFKN